MALRLARVRPFSHPRTVADDTPKKAAQVARLMKQEWRSAANSSGDASHSLAPRFFLACTVISDQEDSHQHTQ